MNNIYIFLILISFAFISCAQKKKDLNGDCITDQQIENEKTSVESLVQRITQTSKKPEWKTLERGCFKSIQSAGEANVIIYKYSQNNELRTKVTTGSFKNRSTPECLQKAITEAGALDLPHSQSIIHKSKAAYGEMWEDSDVGAGSYLSCTDLNSADFYTSLMMFMHELNHFTAPNSKETFCSFFPWADRTDCFDASVVYPALDLLSDKRTAFNPKKLKKDVIAALVATQNTYLGNAKSYHQALLLLDELRSYALGTEILTKLYLKYGKEKVYNSEKKRTSLFPHLAVHELVLQLKALSLKSPSKNKAYDDLFCEALKKSDDTIKDWFRLLKKTADSANVTKEEQKIYDYISSTYGKTSCE